MTRQPDEDYDVIAQQRDGRNTWTTWLRGQKQGERSSRAAAIELARAVATVHSRPAWLLDETGCSARGDYASSR